MVEGAYQILSKESNLRWAILLYNGYIKDANRIRNR